MLSSIHDRGITVEKISGGRIGLARTSGRGRNIDIMRFSPVLVVETHGVGGDAAMTLLRRRTSASLGTWFRRLLAQIRLELLQI